MTVSRFLNFLCVPSRLTRFALALLAGAAIAAPASGQPEERAVAAALRHDVELLNATGSLDVQGVVLGREDILAQFYARRDFEPAWNDAARVRELLALLAASPEHGLDPADFFLDQLKSLAGTTGDAAQRAGLDLLRTEALVRYGYQRRFGKVNPAELEPAWNFERGFADGADPVNVLAEAIASPSLTTYLEERVPGGPWYTYLKAALARYRSIAAAGGWPAVAEGAVLHAGDRDSRVAALRERLRLEGDLATGDPAPLDADVFDEALAAAVRIFQGRHALAADGSVGRQTLDALNLPVAARVDQLRMSLERVRWLAGGAPETYVVVNVAGFRVGYVRDRRLLWNSRVVVGRAARQTPIFRGSMTYVELNPTWTVPPTILREDILPKIKQDPGYLRRENISVIDAGGRVVDPLSVNWKAYSRSVPYTLRQGPGPENSLGRIKLMFPNPHSVYLHDTPAKALFERSERTFSSGCIRVEDPLALAQLVLDDPAWTRATLESAIAKGKTRRISLNQPVPVLLVYLTAVAGPDGKTQFFGDVYKRDASLLRALNGPVRLVLPARRAAAAGTKVGTGPL